MDEKTAIKIFTVWFDPNLYGSREDLKSFLVKECPMETLNQLFIFLEKLIADSTMTNRDKLRKYFDYPVNDEAYANIFLRNNMEDLKDITALK